MGYKSRGNFAPCHSLTDEQFDNIFKSNVDDKEILDECKDFVNRWSLGQQEINTIKEFEDLIEYTNHRGISGLWKWIINFNTTPVLLYII